MGTDKFKKQINKNKEIRTSTDEVTEALYKEMETAEVKPEPQKEPQIIITSPVEKRATGRPKGDDTVRKTVYIPRYNWPYVQAAVKLHGGNLQRYINDIIQNDIDRNRDRYKDLADLFRSIDNNI